MNPGGQSTSTARLQFTILPGLTDEQTEGPETDHRRELRTLKAAAIILSLLTLTGILRRSGTNRLGAAEVLSTTFRC